MAEGLKPYRAAAAHQSYAENDVVWKTPEDAQSLLDAGYIAEMTDDERKAAGVEPPAQEKPAKKATTSPAKSEG